MLVKTQKIRNIGLSPSTCLISRRPRPISLRNRLGWDVFLALVHDPHFFVEVETQFFHRLGRVWLACLVSGHCESMKSQTLQKKTNCTRSLSKCKPAQDPRTKTTSSSRWRTTLWSSHAFSKRAQLRSDWWWCWRRNVSFSLSAYLSLFSALTLFSHAHLWSLKLSLKYNQRCLSAINACRRSVIGPGERVRVGRLGKPLKLVSKRSFDFTVRLSLRFEAKHQQFVGGANNFVRGAKCPRSLRYIDTDFWWADGRGVRYNRFYDIANYVIFGSDMYLHFKWSSVGLRRGLRNNRELRYIGLHFIDFRPVCWK